MAHPLLIPGLLSAGVVTALALTRKPTPPPKTETQQPTQQDINGLIGRARAMIQAAVANPTQADPTQMDCLAFDLNRLGRTMEATQLHEAANVVRTSRGVAPAPMPTVACPPVGPGGTAPGEPAPPALEAARANATTLLAQAAQVQMGTAVTVTPQQLVDAAAQLRNATAMIPAEANIDEAVAVRLENEAKRIAALLGQQPPPVKPGAAVPAWCTQPGMMSALPAEIAAEVNAVLARNDPAAAATATLLADQLQACGGFLTQITQLREKAKFLDALKGVRTGQMYRPASQLGFDVMRFSPVHPRLSGPAVICRLPAGCPLRSPTGPVMYTMPFDSFAEVERTQGRWSRVTTVDRRHTGWVETASLRPGQW